MTMISMKIPEKELIDAKAQKLGMSRTAYMKYLALNYEIVIVERGFRALEQRS